MPSDAAPAAAPPIAQAKTGLAAVDLSEPGTPSSLSQSRYEEYKLDEKDEGRPYVVGDGMQEADMPAQGEVEVVRVKRKKKKAVGKKTEI